MVHLVMHGGEDDDHDDGRDPPYEPAEASRPDVVLDCLDIGIVVIDATTRKLHRSNRAAQDALRAFGCDFETIPGALWSQLHTSVQGARVRRGRFTLAIALVSPDSRRFFARCRFVGIDAVIVTIMTAGLREDDVRRVLADNFALSAQETRIAFLAAQGWRNREIAEHLEIVEGTVKNYLTKVFSALDVRSRTELVTQLHQLLETSDRS